MPYQHVNPVPPLAFAVSRLHRCHSLEQLRLAIFNTVPDALEVDAVALYMLDPKHHAVSVMSWHTSQSMLREYEHLRINDPLFHYILEHKTVSDYRHLIGKDTWSRSPIHELAQRYGFENVMEGPVLVNGQLVGTIRAGRSSERANFNPATMRILTFLCEEVGFVLSKLNDDVVVTEKLTSLAGQDVMSVAVLSGKRSKPTSRPLHSRSTSPTEELSGQLLNVADRIIAGFTNKRIARELGITENTVKYHVKRLFKHYGVSNRVELTRVYKH